MKKLDRIAGGLFIFICLPAGVLVSLVITVVMPSAATQATWLVGTVCGAIVVVLGLTNVIVKRVDFEDKFSKVATPLAAIGLSLLAVTGVFYHFGI